MKSFVLFLMCLCLFNMGCEPRSDEASDMGDVNTEATSNDILNDDPTTVSAMSSDICTITRERSNSTTIEEYNNKLKNSSLQIMWLTPTFFKGSRNYYYSKYYIYLAI